MLDVLPSVKSWCCHVKWSLPCLLHMLSILHAVRWFLSLHYSFWIPYQSAYCGCDSLFWFITPNRSAWDSCLILLVIPALYGGSSMIKKRAEILESFSLCGYWHQLQTPPSLPSFFSLSQMFFVCLYLSFSCRQKHTTPLLNIVRVSDGVIPMGRRVPHFSNLLPLLLL